MGHLTIARVKSCKDRKKTVEEIKKIKINEEFNVNSFELMKSNLKPQGPVYEILERYNLE